MDVMEHVNHIVGYEWGISICHSGCVARKYPYLGGCSGKEKKRFFQLTQDNKYIRWGVTKTPASEQELDRVLPIAKISKIIYGPHSTTLTKYYNNIKGKWRCISIVCTDSKDKQRTIDLLMKNEDHTLGWLIGLTYLVYKAQGVQDKVINLQMNQLLAEYKWVKLTLQIQEKAAEEEMSFGEYVSSVVRECLSEEDAIPDN